ncbi:MAG: bifunctional DNA-formamidopyrimidine glycosylase/DNA-(apurinic or apyrimidinic site) lyase [Gammaproteobacteria bacterium]
MPELPEVETTCRGIAPYITGQTIHKITIRNGQLRWPVPDKLDDILHGHTVVTVSRRGKYILPVFGHGTLIMHLGMSGSLRIVMQDTMPEKHDHVDIEFENGTILRFRDPRRFGCILWTTDAPDQHKLLATLGPEPLLKTFNGKYLFEKSRGRVQAVKTFIMDSHIVVGVGNIYANEALFLSGIRPATPAGKISGPRYKKLAMYIKKTLKMAIKQGGTTLRDFAGGDGKPGYFQQSLNVYGRSGQPCRKCKRPIRHQVIGQRATYYCGHCQR